ncbi:MAG: phosphoglucosamine mutase [Rikenellaceae bacterium]
MALIKSISGIRGTIGGEIGDNLTPIDLVKFTASYASWIKSEVTRGKHKPTVVLGRDARISGEMVYNVVEGTLMGCGVDVISIGLATTPTVEVAVTEYKADGGIILTASHNPKQWNALKLLGPAGEFLDAKQGAKILDIAATDGYSFVEVDDLGEVVRRESFDQRHIDMVLALDLVDVEAVKAKKFKVVVDAVNSVGGTIIPSLLRAMGVEVVELYCTPNGHFPHNPEPLPEHLTEISQLVVESGADLGVVVDPDVDRLALICENGEMFGEEYTLVAVADYILSKMGGNTVSNLSSTRALGDVTARHGGEYSASAVGEVNVVAKMKEMGAVIGGEGNGGIIYPELHYGRDALVGVALMLTYLSYTGMSCSALRATYPVYYMSKNKIQLTSDTDVDAILVKVKEHYASEKVTDIDGVKIDFADGWVHLRKSNTEPIIRVYSEHNSPENATSLAQTVMAFVSSL